MKLAEALILRSDLQINMKKLRDRLIRSSKVQEGTNPPEEPEVLLKELDEVTTQLIEIVQKINTTNNISKIDDKSISDLLAERDIKLQKRAVLNSLIEEGGTIINRYSRSEIKIESTIDVKNIQKQADDLSKEIRETDIKIQQGNWTIDLI